MLLQIIKTVSESESQFHPHKKGILKLHLVVNLITPLLSKQE
jgi:hypothetical protein